MSKKPKNPLTPLAAGCIAGGIEATAVWPMEYIKVGWSIQKMKNLCCSSTTHYLLLCSCVFIFVCSW
jgi:hypothetical protein